MESRPSRVRPARKLTWHRVDDLDFAFRAVLPPEAAAVVLRALRAARDDLEHPHEKDDADGAGFRGDGPPESRMETAENLADALVQVCAAYLNGKAATADNPETGGRSGTLRTIGAATSRTGPPSVPPRST